MDSSEIKAIKTTYPKIITKDQLYRICHISKKTAYYVDSGVKILIAVVIGALLLGGLYTLFNSTIMPTVTSKITGLFSYSGT